MFVSRNDTLYVIDRIDYILYGWLQGQTTPTIQISLPPQASYNVFVMNNGDKYVDNGFNRTVDKYAWNATTGVPVMNVGSSCYGLFVDLNNFVYCSMFAQHQVIKKSLNNSASTSIVVAGTGCPGPAANMLYQPYNIFVDVNFDLYVGDCLNHRVQLFPSGELNGITVAGFAASISYALNCPAGVVLDADGNLFIADSNNNRIVASSPTGFRCIVGCSGVAGSASNQLSAVRTIGFDSFGNIFATDVLNVRVQKFTLATNSCSKYRNVSFV